MIERAAAVIRSGIVNGSGDPGDDAAQALARAGLLIADCCEDCTGDTHRPMCPMWEP
jgi:hypothetical protein